MDNLSPEQRSSNMSAVRGKNTSPELRVRRMLHAMGYRFRLHRKDLPGKPDIVLSKYRLCIFVHGCFWHQHPGCKRATIPETRKTEWQEKFRQNKERDDLVQKELENLGWRACVIWECEAKIPNNLIRIIAKNLKT
ncbi:MAG: very short patch repair endonuclease [Syntrophus sp. (in: bacteria)]|nr:very short patch repair endonuclease [Syntrophus sp. (in: bacteria)]